MRYFHGIRVPHILRGGGEVASGYANALEPTEARQPDRQNPGAQQ